MNQNDEKVVPTEKSATLNLRVNPQIKESAELVLNQLGIPMSTAVTMYLKDALMSVVIVQYVDALTVGLLASNHMSTTSP